MCLWPCLFPGGHHCAAAMAVEATSDRRRLRCGEIVSAVHPSSTRRRRIMPVELTPEEWEWFKRLARNTAHFSDAPVDVRTKLLELHLFGRTRGGVQAT